MAQEIINIGTSPNDGSGDPLRVAFQKINDNFTQLFASGYLTYQVTTIDDAPNQVIFEVPTTMFTQGTFQINSANPSTNDSQNITLNVAIKNDGSAVSWTGYGLTYINSYTVSAYDVIVESGNVQILVSPTANSDVNHFISAQVEVASFELVGTSQPSITQSTAQPVLLNNGLEITFE